MWSLMVVVSASTLLRIFSTWHSYHFTERLVAIVLALLLLEFPVALILRFRKGKTLQTEQVVVFAYLMLMMSTVLAGR